MYLDGYADVSERRSRDFPSPSRRRPGDDAPGESEGGMGSTGWHCAVWDASAVSAACRSYATYIECM